MGKALIDIARSTADKQAVRELIQKQTPEQPVPDLEAPNQYALIIRDQEDRERIVGAIHIEQATFVKHMLVDPAYTHAKFSITLLHNVIESLLRIQGLPYYYFSVPRLHTRIVDLYQKAGAEIMEADSVRFRKAL